MKTFFFFCFFLKLHIDQLGGSVTTPEQKEVDFFNDVEHQTSANSDSPSMRRQQNGTQNGLGSLMLLILRILLYLMHTDIFSERSTSLKNSISSFSLVIRVYQETSLQVNSKMLVEWLGET